MTLTPLETRIRERIETRADALLADLAEHVAIPTGRNHGPGLDRYRAILTDRLAALGATVTLRPGIARPDWVAGPHAGGAGESAAIPPIAVAARLEGGAGPRILLVGHLDTVHDPAGAFRELTAAPDGVTVTGPGAVDMKGGLLVAVTALEALAAEGVTPRWTFALNSDEETGSLQSMHVLHELAGQHDVGLVFEPALADGSLAIERMGSGQFKVEVHGRSAHVGREFSRGVSAVTRLGTLLGEIAALADPDAGVIVNVGPLEGGAVTNAVPDFAAAWGNVRFRDAETGRRLAARLDALATAPDAMPRVIVHQVLNRPAKPKTDAVERLALAARAAAEALGQSLPFAASGGVCDGNVLQAAGLPTLDTLGVRGGNLHRTDEFVEIASLVERSTLVALLVNRLASGQVPGPARSM